MGARGGAECKAGFRACLIQGGHKLTLHLVWGEIRCSSLRTQAGERLVDAGVGKFGAWPSREGVGVGRVVVGGWEWGMMGRWTMQNTCRVWRGGGCYLQADRALIFVSAAPRAA